MSIKILQQVLEHAPVDKGTLLVLIALADSADEQSRECWPSIRLLAERARLSERQVQACVKELAERVILVVIPNAGRNGTNLYRITPVSAWQELESAQDGGVQKLRGGEAHFTGGVKPTSPGGVKPTSPKPSIRTVIEPSDAQGADLFGEKKPEKVKETPLSILMGILPKETAESWIAHRKALKKPLTEAAAALMVGKLREAADPVACVELSIMNGWQGVFPEKAPATPPPRTGHRLRQNFGEVVR